MKKLFWFLLICVALLSIRKVLLGADVFSMGEFVASMDYWSVAREFFKPWSSYLLFGNSNLGYPTVFGYENTIGTLPPTSLSFWFLLKALLQFFTGKWFFKALIISTELIPIWGMYFLARYWFSLSKDTNEHKEIGAMAAALIYGINPPAGGRIIAATFRFCIAYGLFPLLLGLALQILKEKNARKRLTKQIMAGFIFALTFQIMPHFLFLFALALSIYIAWEFLVQKKFSFSYLPSLGLVFLIGFGLNLYIIVPALFFSEVYPVITDTYFAISHVYFSTHFSSIKNVLTFSNGLDERSSFVNLISEQVFQRRLFYPLLAGLGALLVRKRRNIVLLVVAVLGVIISVGVHPPFEALYTYIYEHFFFMKPFRDPSKFTPLYTLSCAVLGGSVFIWLGKHYEKLKSLMLVGLVVVLIYLNPVFFSGDFFTTLKTFSVPSKYFRLRQYFRTTPPELRIAVYPSVGAWVNYNWYPENIVPSGNNTAFNALVPLSRDLALTNNYPNLYSARYIDYLNSNVAESWAYRRLLAEGVGYFVVDHAYKGYKESLRVFRAKKSLKELNAVEGFSIFKVKTPMSQSLRHESAVYYFGDMKGIKAVPTNLALVNLSLIGDSVSDVLGTHASDTLLLYRTTLRDFFYTTLTDYQLSFFPEIRFIRDGATSYYFGGVGIKPFTDVGINFYEKLNMLTGAANPITKTFHLSPGKYRVLVSLLSFPNFGSRISLKIDGERLTTTKKIPDTLNTVVWHDLGSVNIHSSAQRITLKNMEPKPQLVDSLLLIPVDAFAQRKRAFQKMTKNLKIIEYNDEHSLTKEQLSGLKSKLWVFSQTYSPYWRFCNLAPVRVNFFAQGYKCAELPGPLAEPVFMAGTLYWVSLAVAGLLGLGLAVILIIINLNTKLRK